MSHVPRAERSKPKKPSSSSVDPAARGIRHRPRPTSRRRPPTLGARPGAPARGCRPGPASTSTVESGASRPMSTVAPSSSRKSTRPRVPSGAVDRGLSGIAGSRRPGDDHQYDDGGEQAEPEEDPTARRASGPARARPAGSRFRRRRAHLTCLDPARTRPAESWKRALSSGPVGRSPYHARSNSSVASSNGSATSGRVPATSSLYSPAVRPGTGGQHPVVDQLVDQAAVPGQHRFPPAPGGFQLLGRRPDGLTLGDVLHVHLLGVVGGLAASDGGDGRTEAQGTRPDPAGRR